MPKEVLNPKETWADKGGYDDTARELAQRFENNFEQFEDAVTDDVKAAGITRRLVLFQSDTNKGRRPQLLLFVLPLPSFSERPSRGSNIAYTQQVRATAGLPKPTGPPLPHAGRVDHGRCSSAPNPGERRDKIV